MKTQLVFQISVLVNLRSLVSPFLSAAVLDFESVLPHDGAVISQGVLKALGMKGVDAAITCGGTGVEMEALVAVCVALLTVWDMVNQYEKDGGGQYLVTRIEGVRVVRKVKGDVE